MDHKAINQARAMYYRLFSQLLSFVEKSEAYQEVDDGLDIFIANPLDENSLEALKEIKQLLKTKGYQALKEEYDEVFTASTACYIPVSASYYDEGRDDGQKRVKAAGLLLRSKFRRNDLLCKDSEDHVIFLFQWMSRLLKAGVEGDNESLVIAKELFETIINDFIDEFSMLLQEHPTALFYKYTATALLSFIEFERLYLNVELPHKAMSQERIGHARQQERKPLTQKAKRNLDEIVL